MLTLIELYYGFLKRHKEPKEWSDRNGIKSKLHTIALSKGEGSESSKTCGWYFLLDNDLKFICKNVA